jgi:hypothetical protein
MHVIMRAVVIAVVLIFAACATNASSSVQPILDATHCSCPNGGVCFEQIGGPAQRAGDGPAVQCTIPESNGGCGSPNACAHLAGEGTCTDSATIAGLCVCDNGIR